VAGDHPGDSVETDLETDLALEAGVRAEIETLAAERLVFFSDAVVAIAITLLAIDLPLPAGRDQAAFLASLAANAPEYTSFVISFAVIALHWVHHNAMFRYVSRLDGRVVVLNLVWLLLIVITPFMTRLLGGDELTLIRFGMYAGTQALQSTVFAVLGWTLVRHRLLRPGIPDAIARRGAQSSLLAAAAFAVSVPLFALVGPWAFACWAVIPILGSRLLPANRRSRARVAG
jgi:uncharacterized membrane protein